MADQMDHSQCLVTRTRQREEHTCPPCPHGLERGYEFRLNGVARLDAVQRRLNLHRLSNLSCNDEYHAEALAQQEAVAAHG